MKLTDRLSQVRVKVTQSEKELVKTLSVANQVKSNIKRIQTLIALQKQEQLLSQERVKELEAAIGEMAERKGELNEKILLEKRAIRKNIQREIPSRRAAQRARRRNFPRSTRRSKPRIVKIANR